MIGEWLTHLTTPCPQPYRAMGYLKELIAIKYRYQRCRMAWAPHLENCHDLIISATDECPAKTRAVILGSGLLLDIPLAHLAKTFDDVVLIDICHLRSTRSQIKNFPNVRLIESDISGAVLPLSRWLSGSRSSAIPEPEIDKTIITGADYVVSSNLLAQLPLLPLAHLQETTPATNPTLLGGFARSIIDHHISLLQNLDCPVTLISETLRLIANQDRPINKIDPLHGAPLNYAGKEWWWDLAPQPELHQDADVRLYVRGIRNLAAAEPERYCRNTNIIVD